MALKALQSRIVRHFSNAPKNARRILAVSRLPTMARTARWARDSSSLVRRGSLKEGRHGRACGRNTGCTNGPRRTPIARTTNLASTTRSCASERSDDDRTLQHKHMIAMALSSPSDIPMTATRYSKDKVKVQSQFTNDKCMLAKMRSTEHLKMHVGVQGMSAMHEDQKEAKARSRLRSASLVYFCKLPCGQRLAAKDNHSRQYKKHRILQRPIKLSHT